MPGDLPKRRVANGAPGAQVTAAIDRHPARVRSR